MWTHLTLPVTTCERAAQSLSTGKLELVLALLPRARSRRKRCRRGPHPAKNPSA